MSYMTVRERWRDERQRVYVDMIIDISFDFSYKEKMTYFIFIKKLINFIRSCHF